MTNADNNEQAPKTDDSKGIESIRGELDAKLAEVKSQLESMNKQFADSLQTLATAVKPEKQATTTIDDSDLYSGEKLSEKVASVANRIASEALAKERQLNGKIYELSQEFPEIQSDAVLRKAIIEAHNSIPMSLRDTAEGYEMAVLKAVSKSGLVAKSKRKEVEVDPDSMPSRGQGRGGAERRAGGSKKKVSEATLAFAQLLGRDIDDPKVQKGLEEAANRNTWSRYR